MSLFKELDLICREAVSCRSCFHELHLEPAAISIAQPRWVGQNYWSAPKRVVALMLNPGSGKFRNDTGTEATLRILTEYKNHRKTLGDVFESQLSDMPSWGRGRFLKFFQNGLGLDLQTMAFMNLAWCATNNNGYPENMLDSCFEKHGLKLLKLLSPNLALLCGKGSHSFSARVKQAVPGCEVICTLHYAHREGGEREAVEARYLRSLIHDEHTAVQSQPKDKVPCAVAERKMMKYRILRDSSLRQSMRKYKDKGDDRWMLFDALLSSCTYDAYMGKVGGFEKEMISQGTGKPWRVTPKNFFDYVLRNSRIALID